MTRPIPSAPCADRSRCVDGECIPRHASTDWAARGHQVADLHLTWAAKAATNLDELRDALDALRLSVAVDVISPADYHRAYEERLDALLYEDRSVVETYHFADTHRVGPPMRSRSHNDAEIFDLLVTKAGAL